MDSFISFLCHYADMAPFVIFFLLLLTGFSIPISEELLILTAGAVVSICIPDHFYKFLIMSYMGALFSAWIAYGLGKRYGENIYQMPWFKRFITKEGIQKLQKFYEKYGILTFIVGRFCPGGIRNILFMTCGLGKMPFSNFIIFDGIAALLSVSFFFTLGYFFGIHYKDIIHLIKTYDLIAISIMGIIVLGILLIRLYLKKI